MCGVLKYRNKNKTTHKRCVYCGNIMPIPAWKYCSNHCNYMSNRDKYLAKAALKKATKAPTKPLTVSSVRPKVE